MKQRKSWNKISLERPRKGAHLSTDKRVLREDINWGDKHPRANGKSGRTREIFNHG
jgi:hypothetical protein